MVLAISLIIYSLLKACGFIYSNETIFQCFSLVFPISALIFFQWFEDMDVFCCSIHYIPRYTHLALKCFLILLSPTFFAWWLQTRLILPLYANFLSFFFFLQLTFYSNHCPALSSFLFDLVLTLNNFLKYRNLYICLLTF